MFARTSISGFPEWLPAGQLYEEAFLAHLRRIFELHGFTPINTRAVETVAQLQSKGETSKEVYVISRLHDDGTGKKENPLGLHFDLTVPFARYVLDNRAELAFPFCRYQIQRVWRGERPQEGRFREFIQADIDVVGEGTLPFHYDIEMPLIMLEALQGLPLGKVTVMVNNRKLVQGFCEGLGIDAVEGTLRALDKLDKIGAEGVAAELSHCGVEPATAEKVLALAGIRGDDAEVVCAQVRALGVSHPLLDEGLEELSGVLRVGQQRAAGSIEANLKITRGLDYYTGTVYETVIAGHEDLGSPCSGGRYDSLASDGKRNYPGVGMSIGVSRLLSRLFTCGVLSMSRPVPTCVLVAVNREEDRYRSDAIADQLRQRGIPTQVCPTAAKFGKQIKFADRRQIPYVWFVSEDGTHTVKDIRSGAQVEADPRIWMPAEDDLRPRPVLTSESQ